MAIMVSSILFNFLTNNFEPWLVRALKQIMILILCVLIKSRQFLPFEQKNIMCTTF